MNDVTPPIRISRPTVTVLASLNLDISVRAAHLPDRGETVHGSSVQRVLGGKGGNQAVALARLGTPVQVIGRVGSDDAGRSYIAALQAEGADVSGIRISPDAPTGTAVVLVADNGDNCIVVVPGANAQVGSSGLDSIRATLSRSGIVLTQGEVPAEAAAAALGEGRRSGAVTVFNPAPMSRELLSCVADSDIVVPNEVEFAQLVEFLGGSLPAGGPANWTDADLVAAAQPCFDLGVRWLIVTMGSLGSVSISASGMVQRYAPEQVRAVDTTAAGDSFVAGLVSVIAESGSLSESVIAKACARATRVAGYAVQHEGAQPSLPHLSDLAS